MKKLILVGLITCFSLVIFSEEEMTKKEKEEQIYEMVKKYVEQKSVSAEYIISSDKTAASKKLLGKLEGPLTIDWEGATLKEVLDDLRTFLDINIVVHKSVSKDTLIDFKVNKMKGLSAIKWVLKMNDLKGSIVDGVLMITTPEKAPNIDLIMVTYDINDLTNVIKDFPATDIPGLNGIANGK